MPTRTKSRSTTAASPKRGPRSRSHRRVPAIGYASVRSSRALDGPEMDAQREEIERGCRELSLELIDLVHDHELEDPEGHLRPGLAYALERIDSGEASCLIVSDLEHLSGNVGELDSVLERLEAAQRRLVALDVGLDTAAPPGRLAVSTRDGVAPAQPRTDPPAESHEDRPRAPAPPVRPHARRAMRALGYASIPTGDDDAAGPDPLERQRQAIEATCERLGLKLVEIVREREPSAGHALERAGISYLIERLAAGDASCLVVSGLDRVSRSISELGTLVEWLERSEVRLVAVELDLDTLSPEGRAAARTLASVGGYERERLAERTNKGLAAARANRRAGGSNLDWGALRKRIALMRADGMTLQAIADILNEERVPTPRGGLKWRPSSVQSAAGYRRRSRTTTVSDLPAVERPARSGQKRAKPRPKRD